VVVVGTNRIGRNGKPSDDDMREVLRMLECSDKGATIENMTHEELQEFTSRLWGTCDKLRTRLRATMRVLEGFKKGSEHMLKALTEANKYMRGEDGS
jgi:conjugal transfer/entry exclusion protein